MRDTLTHQSRAPIVGGILRDRLLAGTLCIAAWSCAASAMAWSDDRSIYGEDDRRELQDPSIAPSWQSKARSTGLVLYKTSLNISAEGQSYSLKTDTLGSKNNLCSSEPFAAQPAVGHCSAFLVGPDVMVTAGHCVDTEALCADVAVVFDYFLDGEGRAPVALGEDQLYFCKEVLYSDRNSAPLPDFSIFTLDRPVQDRPALAIDENAELASATSLTVIGHPLGLPTKVVETPMAIRAVDGEFSVVAALDTYRGNSGSPVFASDSGALLGVLIRGERDFEITPEGCYVSKRCGMFECRGEDVLRMSVISPYLRQDSGAPTSRVRVAVPELPVAIPDNTLEPAISLSIPVTTSGSLVRLGIRVQWEHSCPRDLSVSLVHPNGQTISILKQGSSAAEAGVGEWHLGEGGVATLRFKPWQGSNIQGTWQLIVKDHVQQDSGQLLSAELLLDYR